MKTILGMTALTILSATALGQFTVDWHTMDSGGATITGGTLELGVTIGQPDASDTVSSATYDLTGGFWAGSPVPPVFCPGDLDGDGDTDVLDFSLFGPAFGSTGLPPFTGGDLDGDGDVDVLDFAIFGPDFGCPN